MIERLYRLLLRLSPAGFRERFGDEVIATAREFDQRRGGPRARIGAVVDAIQTFAALHADQRTERMDVRHARPRRFEGMRSDVTLALRGFRREPLFAGFVIATLALATGANAALFGIADRLLLRGPAHVADADRVVRLYVTANPPGMRTFTSSTVGHVTYEVVSRSVASAASVATYAVNEGTAGRGADARSVSVGYASAGFFPLLGVQPAVGRFFSEEEAVAGAERVAVVSARVWHRDFGGAVGIVNRAVVINDETHVIVGVSPDGFTGVGLSPVDFWVPMSLLSPRVTADWRHSWSAQWLTVVLRLKPGATVERIEADATAAVRAAYTGDEPYMGEARVWVGPLSTGESGAEPAETRVIRWLFGVALAVLLIACANVVNLLLAGERDACVRWGYASPWVRPAGVSSGCFWWSQRCCRLPDARRGWSWDAFIASLARTRLLTGGGVDRFADRCPCAGCVDGGGCRNRVRHRPRPCARYGAQRE